MVKTRTPISAMFFVLAFVHAPDADQTPYSPDAAREVSWREAADRRCRLAVGRGRRAPPPACRSGFRSASRLRGVRIAGARPPTACPSAAVRPPLPRCGIAVAGHPGHRGAQCDRIVATEHERHPALIGAPAVPCRRERLRAPGIRSARYRALGVTGSLGRLRSRSLDIAGVLHGVSEESPGDPPCPVRLRAEGPRYAPPIPSARSTGAPIRRTARFGVAAHDRNCCSGSVRAPGRVRLPSADATSSTASSAVWLRTSRIGLTSATSRDRSPPLSATASIRACASR